MQSVTGESLRLSETLTGVRCDGNAFVTFTNPANLANWTLPVIEATLVVGLVACLIHAIRWYRTARDASNLVVWCSGILALLLVEPIAYFPQWFGIEDELGLTFAHNMFTVQFLYGRLPLYIIAMYPVYLYVAYTLVQRTGIFKRYNIFVSAASVAFVFHCLYQVVDGLGPQLKWWVWNQEVSTAHPSFSGIPLLNMSAFSVMLPFGIALVTRWLCTVPHRGGWYIVRDVVMTSVLVWPVLFVGSIPPTILDLLGGAPVVQRQGHGLRGSRRWDDTMLRARNQADGYARAVAREDGWPPFLLIVDVGHVIEIYADFSGQGQGYTQFPDGNRYRIALDDLRDEATLARLQAIWTDPHSLDPTRVSAQVTREVAAHLAELGRSFEAQGHAPEAVARFLMRALFTMFAEDVQLIPEGAFSKLLQDRRGHPEHAAPMLESLWQTMNTGGFSPALSCDLKRFNGGLFREATALPLSAMQLGLLIQAASHNWREVEPAIFGTLLERALDTRQRHKLGAHYTPRAYVERLVNPTVIEPLRAEWRDIQAAAVTLAGQDKLIEARRTVRDFMEAISERQKEALSLAYFEGFTHSEIASTLGI